MHAGHEWEFEPHAASRERASTCKCVATREIAAHLQEMLGVEVSPTLISAITDTVAD